jgi:hypothetical protein
LLKVVKSIQAGHRESERVRYYDRWMQPSKPGCATFTFHGFDRFSVSNRFCSHRDHSYSSRKFIGEGSESLSAEASLVICFARDPLHFMPANQFLEMPLKTAKKWNRCSICIAQKLYTVCPIPFPDHRCATRTGIQNRGKDHAKNIANSRFVSDSR